ncbi:hypothetical protein B0O95_103124 [Mycetohabitans endofungorum]|uniref:Uncharacterized protein n=1 Tax=Mycetohabitans endofungorum TaxID=417203 RepID=A0A2P5KCI6_9BURK|nr:hypothetical protein B0O95_103124 [Mycetohabitans endofungorum]
MRIDWRAWSPRCRSMTSPWLHDRCQRLFCIRSVAWRRGCSCACGMSHALFAVAGAASPCRRRAGAAPAARRLPGRTAGLRHGFERSRPLRRVSAGRRCAARASTMAGWRRRCAGPCQACDCTIGLAACAARARRGNVRAGLRGEQARRSSGGCTRSPSAFRCPIQLPCCSTWPLQSKAAGAWPGYSGVGKVPSSKSLETPGSLLKSETCQRPLIAST